MAIGSRTATVVENASATSISATLPTDRADKDVIVAVFAITCSLAQFTAPSGGWTQLFSPLFVNDNNVLAAYYRVHTTGDPASAPTVSHSGAANRVSALCQAYSGVSNTNPIDVSFVTSATAPYGTSLAVGGVTTATDGAMLLSGCLVDSSSNTLTEPSGMTEVADASGGGVGRGVSLAQELRATLGVTGTRTWNQSGSSLGMGAFLGALRPANYLSVSGSITAAGSLTKSTTKNPFAGSITATGVFNKLKVVERIFAASITAVGVLRKVAPKVFTGSATPAGSLSRFAHKLLTGSITPTGLFRKSFIRIFTGSITATGNSIVAFAGRVFGRPGIVKVVVEKVGEVRMRMRRG